MVKLSIISIVIAILLFSIIVIFHELGHFLVAKLNGIRVTEFSLGLGPKIVGFKKGETQYTINLLPFGGACVMGEDDLEDNDDPRSFNNKSILARISVVFAGPLFNFIMAFVFAFIIIASLGYDKAVVQDVMPGYSAENAGLKSGDEIVKINNYTVHFYKEISSYSIFHAGEKVDVTYMRDGKKYTTVLEPTYDEESQRYLYGIISEGKREKGNIISIAANSCYEVKYWIYTTLESIKLLLNGGASVNDLQGPVRIVQSVGTAYDQSVSTDGGFYAFLNMLNWGVLLSANLGVMNLLPIPALDGGRIVLMIIEAIVRKPIVKKIEAVLNGVGLILLFGLMFIVMFNDIRNILF